MTLAIEIDGLGKRYGDVVALDNVSFQVSHGEVLGLIGPNGAGKTTLLSILAGLRKPDSGTVRLLGLDVLAHPRMARSLLGYAPQEVGLYQTISVRENLSFFAELAGLRGRAKRARLEEMLTLFKLEAIADRPVRHLSGGEQRRVHVVSALLHSPPMLLLDEPTAGLDVENRRVFLHNVAASAREGTSICYSSHYMPELEELCRNVVILNKGRIAAAGSMEELVSMSGQAVRLRFTGDVARAAACLRNVGLEFDTISEHQLDLRTNSPEAVIGRVLDALGEDVRNLRGIEIIRPSLEAIFFSVTSRDGAQR